MANRRHLVCSVGNNAVRFWVTLLHAVNDKVGGVIGIWSAAYYPTGTYPWRLLRSVDGLSSSASPQHSTHKFIPQRCWRRIPRLNAKENVPLIKPDKKKKAIAPNRLRLLIEQYEPQLVGFPGRPDFGEMRNLYLQHEPIFMGNISFQ